VIRGDGTLAKRICLVEYGKPFMDLKTPLLEAREAIDKSEPEFDMLVCTKRCLLVID